MFKNDTAYVNIKSSKLLSREKIIMKAIADFIINFTTNGGMLYVIIGLFLIGFGIKTAGSLCYDDILDKIENFQIRKNKRAEGIILQYENEVKFGKKINNLSAFVERAMHGWKIKSILVEKMQGIGDIFGKVCLILGICAIAILLAAQKDELSFGSQMTKGIYIYAAAAAILFICLKLWDNVIALDYKRNVIRDEIINYLDNNHAVDGKNIPTVHVEMKNEGKDGDADTEMDVIRTDWCDEKELEEKGAIENTIEEKEAVAEKAAEERKQTVTNKEANKRTKRNSKNRKGKKNAADKNLQAEIKEENKISNAEIEEDNVKKEENLKADTAQSGNRETKVEKADDQEIEKIFDEVLEEFLS